MDGRIAGLPTTEVPIPIQPANNGGATIAPVWDGVPLDVIYYFNLEIRDLDNNTKTKLKEISDYFSSHDISETLNKMRDAELKLGAPNPMENRHNKLWNYIRISRQIDSLTKQRESLYEVRGNQGISN